jgi:hypothetical protein
MDLQGEAVHLVPRLRDGVCTGACCLPRLYAGYLIFSVLQVRDVYSIVRVYHGYRGTVLPSRIQQQQRRGENIKYGSCITFFVVINCTKLKLKKFNRSLQKNIPLN